MLLVDYKNEFFLEQSNKLKTIFETIIFKKEFEQIQNIKKEIKTCSRDDLQKITLLRKEYVKMVKQYEENLKDKKRIYARFFDLSNNPELQIIIGDAFIANGKECESVYFKEDLYKDFTLKTIHFIHGLFQLYTQNEKNVFNKIAITLDENYQFLNYSDFDTSENILSDKNKEQQKIINIEKLLKKHFLEEDKFIQFYYLNNPSFNIKDFHKTENNENTYFYNKELYQWFIETYVGLTFTMSNLNKVIDMINDVKEYHAIGEIKWLSAKHNIQANLFHIKFKPNFQNLESGEYFIYQTEHYIGLMPVKEYGKIDQRWLNKLIKENPEYHVTVPVFLRQSLNIECFEGKDKILPEYHFLYDLNL